MKNLKLIITRHSESIWNKKNCFTGWSNIGLTEKGYKDSFKTANILKNNDIIPDRIFTSKLIRSINTSEIIKDTLKIENKIETSWRLNERHYGILEGMNRDLAIEKYGKDNIKNIRQKFYYMPYLDSNNRAIINTCNIINNEEETPIGESNDMVYKRVLPYWENIIKDYLYQDEILLIVSHKNTLRCLMRIFENLSVDEFSKTDIKNNELLLYNFDKNFKLNSKFYLY